MEMELQEASEEQLTEADLSDLIQESSSRRIPPQDWSLSLPALEEWERPEDQEEPKDQAALTEPAAHQEPEAQPTQHLLTEED